jgi:hypothetical protein
MAAGGPLDHLGETASQWNERCSTALGRHETGSGGRSTRKLLDLIIALTKLELHFEASVIRCLIRRNLKVASYRPKKIG